METVFDLSILLLRPFINHPGRIAIVAMLFLVAFVIKWALALRAGGNWWTSRGGFLFINAIVWGLWALRESTVGGDGIRGELIFAPIFLLLTIAGLASLFLRSSGSET